MTRHRIEAVYTIDNTRSLDFDLSSKKLGATSIEFSSQQAFIVAHLVVNMDFTKDAKCQKKKGQIVKMLTLKRKVKCHFMKQGEYVLEGDKDQNTSLFSFSIKQVAFVFCFQNECRRKFCGKIAKTIQKKVAEVERRTREIERAVKVCKYFAFAIQVARKESTISLHVHSSPPHKSFQISNQKLEKTREIVRKL